MLSLYSLALISLVLFTGCGSQSRKAGADQSAQNEIQQQEAAQLAPPLELDDLNGIHFSLGAMKGKVVFLDFWATWCPPCIRSVPEVIKLEQDYGPKGVVIASLSVDEDVSALRRFVANRGMKNRVFAASGTPAPEAFGVRAIPRFLIIDKEGRIVGAWEGFHPAMVDKWRSLLDRLLKN